jgi:hypothetical protein
LERFSSPEKIAEAKDKALKEITTARAFDSQIPVGTIIASYLPQEKMREVSALWMLANGSDVPPDSAYAKLFPNTKLPNLQGVFLRGRNYDRPLDAGNPEGDKPVGTYQSDMLKRHQHVFRTGNLSPVSGPPRGDDGGNFREQTTDFYPKTESEGLETRPRNVTVNLYIKIN